MRVLAQYTKSETLHKKDPITFRIYTSNTVKSNKNFKFAIISYKYIYFP